LLTNVISTKANPSSSLLPVLQQLLANTNSPIDKISSQQEDMINRGEKRKTSSSDEKKSKQRPSVSSNFYSLLAQIHNINNTDDST
jgi:hypothetical protein